MKALSGSGVNKPYACVFAGARDHYQAAVALAEAGRLHTLLNEFYVPSFPKSVQSLLSMADRSKRLRSRACPDLPGELVRIPAAALIAEVLNRVWKSLGLTTGKDRALGRACGRLARQHDLPVLAYSYYASYAFEEMPPHLLRVIFQVHPHPAVVRRILSDELRLSPVAHRSLLGEHELNFPAALLDRLSREAREAHCALTPSSFAKHSLIEAGVPADRITVVPYGIDAGVFAPKEFNAVPADQPLRLIFVGSLVQRKGLSYLFEAVRRLRGDNIELVLVGRGARDDALLAQFIDVPFRLVWNAPRADLVRELQAADVFVFPSLVESFAHVILEAMSVGLPVITTTNTAGPDLLEEGRTGFVGSIRDVDFLVEKIRWFLADRSAIARMGRACQEEAALHTWPRFRVELRQALERFETQF